ncbi:autotransporter domain-containing protein [Pseudochelatococcus sp. B33]
MAGRAARLALTAALLSSTALIAAGAVAPAHAQAVVWGGGTSEAWEVSTNWSGGVLPGATSDVVIDVGGIPTPGPVFTGAGALNVGTITINGGPSTAGVLTISGGTLTATGDVTLQGDGGGGPSAQILIDGANAELVGAELKLFSGGGTSFEIRQGSAEFGSATISAGELKIGAAGGANGVQFLAGGLTVNNDGAVGIRGSETFAVIAGDVSVTGAGAELTLNAGAPAAEGRGLSITGGLTASDSATLSVIRGLLNVGGDLTLGGGSLAVSGADAKVDVGGTLTVSGNTGDLSIGMGEVDVTGAATVGTGGKLSVGPSAATLTVAGLTVSGAGEVSVAGEDTLLTIDGDASLIGENTRLTLDTGGAPADGKGIAIDGKLDAAEGATIEVRSGLLAVTGDLTVADSTLKVSGDDDEEGEIRAANVIVSGTGVFELGSGGSFEVDDISLVDEESSFVVVGDGDAEVGSRITGDGLVHLSTDWETNTLELQNEENDFTGGITVTKGTLVVSDVAALGAEGSRTVRFGAAVAEEAIVLFDEDIESDDGVTFARVDAGNAIVIGAAGTEKTFSINQELGGEGDVILGANGGTIALTGKNTYGGEDVKTRIYDGTLQISTLDNLGAGGEDTGDEEWTRLVEIGDGAGLAIAGAGDFTDDTSLRITAANDFAISVDEAANTFTLSNKLTSIDTGTLEKKGDGKLVLAQSEVNDIAGVRISGGTLAATAEGQLGGGAISLNGGFLNVGTDADTGIASDDNLTIRFEKGSEPGETLRSGFDIDADKSFTLDGGVVHSGEAGDGTITLVKKGDGTLVLGGVASGAQVDNIIEAGTLSVTDAAQLGDGTKQVTFAGGALGIGDGAGTAALADDTGILLVWGGDNADGDATIDVAQGSSFTIADNAFGVVDDEVASGALVKKGEGTLVLSNADIAYEGGTVVEAGTLKVDDGDDKFRLLDGKYTVNGGTLEADVSDLTITELAGSGKTGAEILDSESESYDPARYELDAGTIVIASGEADDGDTQRETTLTINQTTGDTGFWGKIVGFFTEGADSEADPRALAGTLEIDAADKEVVLTGNASEVDTVNVKAGTLRVDNGTLPVSDLLGAPTTTYEGSLTANAVNVDGTEDARASLAGSGTVSAPVSVGQYGSLLGNKAGTLTINGDVTFEDGATIELGGFLLGHHNAAGTEDITNQYFHVDGTVTAAEDGTFINLNNDAIDPGIYRVISSTEVIVNGDSFAVGSIGEDLPAGSVVVSTTGEGHNIDLVANTGRAASRFWNGTPVDGVSTWTVDGNDWTDLDKTNPGPLHQTEDGSRVGVFGHSDFPQQGGTVNVSGANYLTQGLQFFASDWLLTGDALELKGGAAETEYEGRTTINTGAGNIVINNQLTGSAALRKTGIGTLTLWGDNTYAGGTIVDVGTLAVANDAHLGDAGGSITLNGTGATLALGPDFGSTARDIVVNLPAETSGSVNQASTIDLGGVPLTEEGTVRFGGTLTGNGLLTFANGGAVFTSQNAVDFAGAVHVAADAGLAVEYGGSINTLSVDGALWGTFGHTLTVTSLNLASTAEVVLELPADSNGVVAAFTGTNAVLGGEIAELDLPEDYAVGANGTSLPVFIFDNHSGEITISDAVKDQYANSNFTFGGVVNGYLVLNSKTSPVPQPGDGETVNVDQFANLQNWSETTFVDGQTWNNGVATFNGNGTNKPINVEGQVRIAGLTINGQNFLFRDAGVASRPGAFLLQAASGRSVVEFTVAQNGSATIAIPIAGADFVKMGAGHLVLAGNSPDFTGTGTVQAGTLYVTGNFANGSFAVTGGLLRVNGFTRSVTVGPNGTLEGLFSGDTSGRGINIGTLVVNGGTLKPGNSPGLLRVGGLEQTAGAIEFERGDKIEVLAGVGGTPNGRAIFSKAADGAQVDLRLTADSRSYTYGNTYTFVTAENGVTFTSSDAVKVTEVGNGRLFSSFAAEAVGTQGNFYLKRDRAFGTQASNGNQLAVAGALESLTPTDLRSSRGTIYDAIASASNDEAHLVRAAFDQLSGEVHASARGVLVDESRHLREATTNRTRAALSGSAAAAPGQVVQAPAGSNLALWGQVYGSWGETDSSSNTAKLDRSTGGFVLGFDTGIADNWRLGIAGGYAKSDIKSNANLSKADVDNYNLAVYGGGQFGNLGLRFGFGHTWHRLETERQLNVLGLRDSNQAKYDARTLQLYAEAGYEVTFDAATVEPFLNLAYVHHSSDSFVERGLGLGSALTSHSQDESTGFSTLGLRLSKNFDLSGAKGTATGTFGWRHAFGDVNPTGVFSAANGTSLFAITGAPIAKNALVLGVGLDVEIAHGTTLGVSYNGQVGDNTSDHGVRGNFSVKF